MGHGDIAGGQFGSAVGVGVIVTDNSRCSAAQPPQHIELLLRIDLEAIAGIGSDIRCRNDFGDGNDAFAAADQQAAAFVRKRAFRRSAQGGEADRTSDANLEHRHP